MLDSHLSISNMAVVGTMCFLLLAICLRFDAKCYFLC